ncbi:divergent polysaccharide deacetylase family protein [Benzoatithermus flavus]|uniref:Divergent polysaccharide deacetylase family protein n=1 Tax=Benzoatithermus flavus TaxID=3108223 RepID=A0ABU8XL04_9PROT
MIERTEPGDLPRIAADGRTSLCHYARRGDAPCERACLAVVVLGLAREPSAWALDLPPVVGLAFSTYAEGLPDWQARVRAAGHEVLLELPLQPRRFPEADAGPSVISCIASAEAQVQTLLEVLATGAGYLAVTAPVGAFAAEPARFAPIAQTLHARGLGFVEFGAGTLRETAGETALPYENALAPDGDEAASDRTFAAEAEALGIGRALLTVPPTPAALERLGAWLGTLPGKGITLVAPSTLLDGAASSTRISEAQAP